MNDAMRFIDAVERAVDLCPPNGRLSQHDVQMLRERVLARVGAPEALQRLAAFLSEAALLGGTPGEPLPLWPVGEF